MFENPDADPSIIVSSFERLCAVFGAIVVGVVLGCVAALGLRRLDAHAIDREARHQERLAAIILYEEIKAAIEAIDMALKDDSSKWLVSMSESITLTEAWREQAEALQGVGADRWQVLSDAVSAMEPNHGLGSVKAAAEDLRRLLLERRELLVESAEILLRVRGHRTQRRLRPLRARSLLV